MTGFSIFEGGIPEIFDKESAKIITAPVKGNAAPMEVKIKTYSYGMISTS